eukprot:TRINITY_DN12336_c0_g1_i1.p1 TRINITY_DN12336_c0_g1~~TRINITY_DN12336_c0_g1_i1.p1  ORF type:complete len:858 (+),score=72.64 TRINITY_DN12336_c0_g1_i1:32-2605(+)
MENTTTAEANEEVRISSITHPLPSWGSRAYGSIGNISEYEGSWDAVSIASTSRHTLAVGVAAARGPLRTAKQAEVARWLCPRPTAFVYRLQWVTALLAAVLVAMALTYVLPWRIDSNVTRDLRRYGGAVSCISALAALACQVWKRDYAGVIAGWNAALGACTVILNTGSMATSGLTLLNIAKHGTLLGSMVSVSAVTMYQFLMPRQRSVFGSVFFALLVVLLPVGYAVFLVLKTDLSENTTLGVTYFLGWAMTFVVVMSLLQQHPYALTRRTMAWVCALVFLTLFSMLAVLANTVENAGADGPDEDAGGLFLLNAAQAVTQPMHGLVFAVIYFVFLVKDGRHAGVRNDPLTARALLDFTWARRAPFPLLRRLGWPCQKWAPLETPSSLLGLLLALLSLSLGLHYDLGGVGKHPTLTFGPLVILALYFVPRWCFRYLHPPPEHLTTAELSAFWAEQYGTTEHCLYPPEIVRRSWECLTDAPGETAAVPIVGGVDVIQLEKGLLCYGYRSMLRVMERNSALYAGDISLTALKRCGFIKSVPAVGLGMGSASRTLVDTSGKIGEGTIVRDGMAGTEVEDPGPGVNGGGVPGVDGTDWRTLLQLPSLTLNPHALLEYLRANASRKQLASLTSAGDQLGPPSPSIGATLEQIVWNARMHPEVELFLHFVLGFMAVTQAGSPLFFAEDDVTGPVMGQRLLFFAVRGFRLLSPSLLHAHSARGTLEPAGRCGVGFATLPHGIPPLRSCLGQVEAAHFRLAAARIARWAVHCRVRDGAGRGHRRISFGCLRCWWLRWFPAFCARSYPHCCRQFLRAFFRMDPGPYPRRRHGQRCPEASPTHHHQFPRLSQDSPAAQLTCSLQSYP